MGGKMIDVLCGWRFDQVLDIFVLFLRYIEGLGR